MNLEKLISLSYEDFVKELKTDIAKHKVSALIDAGRDDGLPEDEKILFSSGTTVVSNLIPLQKQLIFEKSIKFFLTGKSPENTKKILSGVPVIINKKPIITLNGKYIIDGHHKWVEPMLINPNSRIVIYDMKINVKPKEALKIIQLAIASFSKDLPYSKNEGTNILTIKEKAFKKKVKKTVSPDFLKMMNKDSKDLADYLWGNVLLLKQNNAPIDGALDRTLMPQISKLKKWNKKLKTGEINFKPPFKQTNEHLSFNNFLKDI